MRTTPLPALAAVLAASASASAATLDKSPVFNYITGIQAFTDGSIFDNGVDINFVDGKAFIGKTTTTSCAVGVDCSGYGNLTAIAVDMDVSHETIAASAVQPNQLLYIAANGDLAYTAPGMERPSDAVQGSFTRAEAFNDSGTYLYNFYRFLGQGWFACPSVSDSSVYSVSTTLVAAKSADCVRFVMRAGTFYNNRTVTAYEYVV